MGNSIRCAATSAKWWNYLETLDFHTIKLCRDASYSKSIDIAAVPRTSFFERGATMHIEARRLHHPISVTAH